MIKWHIQDAYKKSYKQSRAVVLPTDTFIAFCRIRVKIICVKSVAFQDHYTVNPLLSPLGVAWGGGGGGRGLQGFH